MAWVGPRGTTTWESFNKPNNQNLPKSINWYTFVLVSSVCSDYSSITLLNHVFQPEKAYYITSSIIIICSVFHLTKELELYNGLMQQVGCRLGSFVKCNSLFKLAKLNVFCPTIEFKSQVSVCDVAAGGAAPPSCCSRRGRWTQDIIIENELYCNKPLNSTWFKLLILT